VANSYNSNPIILDTDISTGWRANQTLNTGNSPATIQQPNPSARQWGIRPYKIILESAGVTSAGTVTIQDPIDSTVLWNAAVASAAGPSGTVIPNDRDDFEGTMPLWRDFKVTGLTATVTKIYIWYRS
jgi:hypothetical protein